MRAGVVGARELRWGFWALLVTSLALNLGTFALGAWLATRPSPPTVDPNPVCHLVKP